MSTLKVDFVEYIGFPKLKVAFGKLEKCPIDEFIEYASEWRCTMNYIDSFVVMGFNMIAMRFLLQSPTCDLWEAISPGLNSSEETSSLWVILHGAFATAEQAMSQFRYEAALHGAFLFAPEATRACGQGYCWSFAQDAIEISREIARLQTLYSINPAQIMVIGYSMGCTMGCWLVAQNPRLFACFAALGMGSAFERWEHDDGGIDELGLSAAAATTRVLLAVDRSDPSGTSDYFDQNLSRLQTAGLQVDVYRPDAGTHELTVAMKERALQFFPKKRTAKN